MNRISESAIDGFQSGVSAFQGIAKVFSNPVVMIGGLIVGATVLNKILDKS